jgi:hypothetical protein
VDQRGRAAAPGVWDKAAIGREGGPSPCGPAASPGVLASAYGCVFCGYWHVGPALSMDTIEALARAIRRLES